MLLHASSSSQTGGRLKKKRAVVCFLYSSRTVEKKQWASFEQCICRDDSLAEVVQWKTKSYVIYVTRCMVNDIPRGCYIFFFPKETVLCRLKITFFNILWHCFLLITRLFCREKKKDSLCDLPYVNLRQKKSIKSNSSFPLMCRMFWKKKKKFSVLKVSEKKKKKKYFPGYSC